ncbi:MAG: transposase, partial [Kiritimatiellae bacterium]|nr:transposase [Kiritimatiellia bacterium]
QIFDPLDFIAEITQHIPNKGEHTIRYYGFYSNKARGVRAKSESADLADIDIVEEDLPGSKLARSRWAALIQKDTFPLSDYLLFACSSSLLWLIVTFPSLHAAIAA